MAWLSRVLDLVLQVVTLAMLVALSGVVVVGVAFRYSGSSLIWYDEVAAVLLAWITFTGAALATLRNAHLGFNGLLFGLPLPARLTLFFVVEAIFLAICLIVVWGGWTILGIFGNETMTTLRFVPRSVVQSILPVSAGLMIAGRLLTLPKRLTEVRAGVTPETQEIEQEIARAEAELAHLKSAKTP